MLGVLLRSTQLRLELRALPFQGVQELHVYFCLDYTEACGAGQG